MSNTITAYFKGRIGVAESVYQNDYGIVMVFDSIDLPAHFDCYFSILNQDEAVPGVGADRQVVIPNSVLSNPGLVTIHIPVHTGSNDSEVEYIVYFKVIGRARPIDDGTPVQMTAIERALALLSQPITNIEEIVNEALSFTGETIAELQESFDNLESDVSSDINSFKTEIRGDIADVEHDFDILDGQFQTAVAAITVDSEVQGIRTGDDGVTYTSAGEAVRKQFSDVKSTLTQTEQEVFDDTILNLSWEKGSFDANGALSDSDYRARVSSFLAVKENDLIIMPNNGSYAYSIQQYDASKAFVSALGWLDPEYYIYRVPSGVGFVRFGCKVNGGVAITDTILASLNANKFTQMTPFMDILRASVNANTEELSEVFETIALINDKTYASLTWEQGSITNGVDTAGTTRARINGYIPVSKGDKLVFSTNGGKYNFAYSLIGTNYVFQSVVGWVTEDTIYEVPSGVAYLRINAKAIPDVIFDATELDKIKDFLYVAHTGYEQTDFLNKKPKRIRQHDTLIGQDCTMVDDKLWIFYDSDTNSTLYKLDLETEDATVSQQHLGHCNSVDYNPNNKCLLVYKTSAANDPQAIIYKNPSEKDDLKLTDSDCTLVNLYNGTSYLNPSASICWGENDNIIYMMDGIYDNLSNNHLNPNITIKKIMLGMGSNDYSSEGYGAYVSGKADDEYNGTCKVLKTYNGAITVGFNAIFDPTNPSGTAQGMEFDGDIYIGWGFAGHNFLQIKLHDDDDSYQVVRNFMHYFTDNAGNVRYLEPEMLALNGDTIICGSIKSPYFEVLSFSRN